jgi:hypothetical protein
MEKRQSYTLLRDGAGWAFRSPEQLSRTYASREVALAGVFAAIERSVSEGDAVELSVPGIALPFYPHLGTHRFGRPIRDPKIWYRGQAYCFARGHQDNRQLFD